MRKLVEVAGLFLRLGVTGFGGPAAHIALIERECVQRRAWITRESFLDLLGVANLIPGPTSTELVMHVGRHRAGWPGLIVAGLAFIVPAAVMVALLAAVYVRAGDLPVVRGVFAGVAPVVVVLIVQALVPLAPVAFRSAALAALAGVALLAVAAGVPEIYVLLAAGALHVAHRGLVGRAAAALIVMAVPAGAVAAEQIAGVEAADVFGYFVRVGSLLFGSGYVLLPVLEGDLVDRLEWLTERQLLDAIAAGQATPGPLFTTATFIGYVLGGPWTAAVATAGMFLPAFVFSALSSAALDRLRASRVARAFLDGVNAAAVALIVVVVVMLARTAFAGWPSVAVAAIAAVLLFTTRIHATVVLLGAAAAGALPWGLTPPLTPAPTSNLAPTLARNLAPSLAPTSARLALFGWPAESGLRTPRSECD